MRFKTFLESQWANSKMEFADMVEWVENNASRFMLREQHIFRGMPKEDAEGLYNGANLNRRSSFALFNYYNLWLSNDSAWQDFPKRDKSFICTTDMRKAIEYGDPYYVIPADKTPIGICPKDDIWFSFPDVSEALGVSHYEGGNPSVFVECLDDIFQNVLKYKVPDDDWEIFQKSAMSVSMFDIMDTCKNEWFYPTLISYARKHHIEDVDTLMANIFDPNRNKFALEKASNFNALENREVWMSGAVLFVTENTYEQLIREFK